MEGEARKPGERRAQILQTLAAMLQEPQPEKITTAALAARVGVSEAALYRHFSSKAQMYEGLIELLSRRCRTDAIIAETPSPCRPGRAILNMLLNLVRRIRGMRVDLTPAKENERLQNASTNGHRIRQWWQCLRLRRQAGRAQRWPICCNAWWWALHRSQRAFRRRGRHRPGPSRHLTFTRLKRRRSAHGQADRAAPSSPAWPAGRPTAAAGRPGPPARARYFRAPSLASPWITPTSGENSPASAQRVPVRRLIRKQAVVAGIVK
jgi:TetR/AcrR family transcriptional regulator